MPRTRGVLPPIHLVPRAFPWLVAALAIVLRGRLPLELVPPAACPGLLELASVAAVRLDAHLTLGAWFPALHAIAIAAAVAAMAQLVARTTGSLTAAAAIGLAVSVGPAFPASLAPPWHAAAFAIATAAALVLTRPSRRSTTAAAIVVVVLLAAPAVVPPPTPAGPGAWETILACAAPVGGVPATAVVGDMARTAAALTGPLGMALALLGAFVCWSNRESRVLIGVAGVAAAGVIAAAWWGPSASVAGAPILVATWWLAARGLADLIARTEGRGWSRAGVLVLAVLTPVLQMSHVRTEIRDDHEWPIGHASIARPDLERLLDLLPSDAALVEEDAGVDVLQRALSGRMRAAGKALPLVPRAPERVEAALAARPVFAWPLAQRELQRRGFILRGVVPAQSASLAQDPLDGLARVAGRLACREVTQAWTDVSDVIGAGRVVVVAGTEAAHGPVRLVVGGPAAIDARADDWPGRTRRGLHTTSFAAPVTDPQAARGVWARRQELPDDLGPLHEPFVARLTIFRTPRAPLALPIELVGQPTRASVSRDQGAGGGDLVLCAMDSAEVRPFRARD